MKKVFVDAPKQVQKVNTFPEEMCEYKNQFTFINKMFFDEEFTEKKELIRELKNKLQSYKSQDKRKKVYDDKNFIDFDTLVEKIIASKMHCHYCGHCIYLFYNNSKEPRQWTLDRINNSLGHNCDNVVISCLDCNLRRGTLNKDKYLFTKKMKIVKKYD